MLRIERSTNGQVVFTLSGRMQTEDIEQFQQLLVVETPGQQLMFNLRNVTLVNQDAVTSLAHCQANGVKIEKCPLYIRKLGRSGETPEQEAANAESQVPDGSSKRFLLMLSDRIFDSRVDRAIPSLAAAPDGPNICPRDSRRASSIIVSDWEG